MKHPHIARLLLRVLAAPLCGALLAGCSAARHVPQGQYLLDDNIIRIADTAATPSGIHSADLVNYLRQQPNHKVLWGVKLQLGIYNLSGHDSTRWYNKWVRRIGNAPVVYDHNLTGQSVRQLSTALTNKGFMHATVTADTVVLHDKRQVRVTYNVTPGEPHRISTVAYNIPNDTLRRLIMRDSALFPAQPGALLDRTMLDAQRQAITDRLRNRGYFAFNKDYITFTADTAAGSSDVALTMNLMRPYQNAKMPYYDTHRPFYVRHVVFVTNYDPVTMHGSGDYLAADTVVSRGYNILYGPDRYLRPGVLRDACFIVPGSRYRARDISRTYEAFGKLGIVKFINIETVPVGALPDGNLWLDVYILLSRTKDQSVSFSVEGTNSEGDLGFALGMGYQHRNIFKGSEVLNAKFRASYESLSGNLTGLVNSNYSEYSAEVGVTYPKFLAPFLRRSFKKKLNATTSFTTNFNYQTRPEYTRVIAGAGWKYTWNDQRRQTRQVLNLLDINYVYLPKSRSGFLDSISNPLLRYSYENHFIMSLGYSYYHTNRKASTLLSKPYQSDVYTIRAAAETAGNVLYAVTSLTSHKPEQGKGYKVFGIDYSQYFKLDADYSYTHSFSPRTSLAVHVGAGVAVPYGNSRVVPFEKRFYAGGANSVRGWGVRTLGPGSYSAANSVNRFIYQCGDIRLDMNVEYRAKLFWVIELGAFIDAGNIWTIRNYDDQPGGVFRFDKFYEQIALGYGLGLRLDFTYFLLRLDMGMKAHNPAAGQEHWPLLHPDWKRDSAFHFSVGYPF